MNKHHHLLLAAVLTALTFSVAAETISYTFASVKYARFSSLMNGFSENIDGEAIALDLSYSLRPSIAIIAGYNKSNADLGSSGITYKANIDALSLGLVAHLAINDSADFLLGASFVNGDVKVDGDYSGSEDINGGISFIGFRNRISDYVELDGYLRKHSINDASSISANFVAAYFVKKSVSIDLDYSLDADGYTLALGATKYF